MLNTFPRLFTGFSVTEGGHGLDEKDGQTEKWKLVGDLASLEHEGS